jgi:glucokinase
VLLAGDIGGTRARLTLLAPDGRVSRREVFESGRFPSLEAVLRTFLGKPAPRVTAAAFGVAGPVVHGRCVATNLPWVIDARVLERRLAIKKVTLLNDLVALSLGSLSVSRSKLRVLGKAGLPKKKGANVAVIAAGTGLGEAMLVWDDECERFVPSPTEGGHTDFAPSDDLEAELLVFLRDRFGHVSGERILSGSGLGNLYDFFRVARNVGETATNTRALGSAPDRNAAIAELGQAGESRAATEAVELFARIYGAEAGNLALKTLAVGGVYVCGNIAAKMLPVLERGTFRAAFEDKGRFRGLMEKVPVAVVLDSDVGLAGAKRVAMSSRRASRTP